jgi:hypothetical protein
VWGKATGASDVIREGLGILRETMPELGMFARTLIVKS